MHLYVLDHSLRGSFPFYIFILLSIVGWAMRSARVRVTPDAEATCDRIQEHLASAEEEGHDDVTLVLDVQLAALRPSLIGAFKRHIEPLRNITKRVCSEIIIEVPSPLLRAAVRGTLAVFGPDVPVGVRAPCGRKSS